MKTLLTCLALFVVSTTAMAATKPVNLSLVPDVAIYDRNTTINGLTLSIWGENQQSSLAIGIANGTTGSSAGLSLGILNYADNYTGCQWGLVNYAKGDFTGWQGGFFFGLIGSIVNITDGNMKGVQIGGVNYAGRLTGLQLGVVNYAKEADSGVQIGLINIIPQNTRWFSELPERLAPAMIFLNWRF